MSEKETRAVEESSYPFHTVCSGSLTKHITVAEDGDIRSIGELRIVSRRSEVEFAMLLGKSIEFCHCSSLGCCNN